MSQDELLQCYDEDGNPTEGRPRSEVKQMPPRWWYAVARVWLVNGKGELMCSKRAGHVAGNPGKWQTYFGGHVGEGDTIKETAKRELEEEAGLARPLEDFFFVNKGRREEKRVFFENYAVRFDGQPSDLHFSDSEVAEARWISMLDYENEKASHPQDWCNACPPEAQAIILAWIRGESLPSILPNG
jgi:8-oxo-dGTP pyrophosphatase MutT (NUDIX family)